jgi:hypothetical protein
MLQLFGDDVELVGPPTGGELFVHFCAREGGPRPATVPSFSLHFRSHLVQIGFISVKSGINVGIVLSLSGTSVRVLGEIGGELKTEKQALRLAVLAGVTSVILGGMPASAITIIASYDPSITANAAALADVQSIVTYYDALFSNSATVNIYFQFGTTGLGESSTEQVNVPYGAWVGALGSTASGSNSYAQSAYSVLNSSDPLAADNSGFVTLTNGNARALGFSVATPNNPGVNCVSTPTPTNPANIVCGNDATITIGSTQPYEYNQTATPGDYDFYGVVEHELDEVLGIGSELNELNANGHTSIPTGTTFAVEDYFRYACGSNGASDVTLSTTDNVCFSGNGGASDVAGAQFYQEANGSGDYNDWIWGSGGASTCPPTTAYVQDAFACANDAPSSYVGINSPEGAVLQTLGYNASQQSVPEPGTFGFCGLAMGGIVLLRSGVRWARNAL